MIFSKVWWYFEYHSPLQIPAALKIGLVNGTILWLREREENNKLNVTVFQSEIGITYVVKLCTVCGVAQHKIKAGLFHQRVDIIRFDYFRSLHTLFLRSITYIGSYVCTVRSVTKPKLYKAMNWCNLHIAYFLSKLKCYVMMNIP